PSQTRTSPCLPAAAQDCPSGLMATAVMASKVSVKTLSSASRPAGKAEARTPRVMSFFEMLGFGIIAPFFPLRHCPPGDAQPLGQLRLRQAEAGAQRQHHLSEGRVTFTIRGPFHRRPPF